MKRALCLMLSVILTAAVFLSSSAFTVQGDRVCTGADQSGVYRITFSGKHADITRCSDDIQQVGIDVPYTISAVCGHDESVLLLCDDTRNGQLVVYTYDMDTDVTDSFALCDTKLYGNTDFCCDKNTLYIESVQNNREVKAVSFNGSLLNAYRFPQEIADVFCGFDGSAYAVIGSILYRLSDSGPTQIAGADVEAPLFPADDAVILSVYGQAYILCGNRIETVFDVEMEPAFAAACVVGNTLYCSRGTMIAGYDIGSGEKICYYDCRENIRMLYSDGAVVNVVRDGAVTEILPRDFISVKKSASSSQTVPENHSANNDPPDSKHISSTAYHVDHTAYRISGIPTETTIAAFKANMNYSGYSPAVYRDSAEKKSGHVGTAMTAAFRCADEVITYELSVTGDLTGEGSRNTRDLNILMDYLIGTADFDGVYELAADLSADGRIDVIDLALMKRSV